MEGKFLCLTLSFKVYTLVLCPCIQLNGTIDKIQSISQQIVSKLNQDCQCGITTAYITAAQLSCDPKEIAHAIYRAQLSSTQNINSTDLASALQQWISSGSASITVDHVQLNLEMSCNAVIDSFSDPVCSAPVPTTERAPVISSAGQVTNGSSSGVTTALISVIIIAVILISVVILAFVIYQRVTSSGKYNLR